MALQFTSNQGIRVLDSDEFVWNVPDALLSTVQDIEKLLVQRFDSATDRSNKLPLPEEGMMSYLRDTNEWHGYNGTAWVRIYPSSPRITSGTSAPSANGQTGDIYVQYT